MERDQISKATKRNEGMNQPVIASGQSPHTPPTMNAGPPWGSFKARLSDRSKMAA